MELLAVVRTLSRSDSGQFVAKEMAKEEISNATAEVPRSVFFTYFILLRYILSLHIAVFWRLMKSNTKQARLLRYPEWTHPQLSVRDFREVALREEHQVGDSEVVVMVSGVAVVVSEVVVMDSEVVVMVSVVAVVDSEVVVMDSEVVVMVSEAVAMDSGVAVLVAHRVVLDLSEAEDLIAGVINDGSNECFVV